MIIDYSMFRITNFEVTRIEMFKKYYMEDGT